MRAFPNTYYSNPEDSLVFTGKDQVFNISTLPNLGPYFTYKFNNSFGKNLGISLTTVGIVTILILLITKNRRGINQFHKKYWTRDYQDNN